jgi:hypothetical protein
MDVIRDRLLIFEFPEKKCLVIGNLISCTSAKNWVYCDCYNLKTLIVR